MLFRACLLNTSAEPSTPRTRLEELPGTRPNTHGQFRQLPTPAFDAAFIPTLFGTQAPIHRERTEIAQGFPCSVHGPFDMKGFKDLVTSVRFPFDSTYA